MGVFPASRSRSPPVPLYRSLLLSSETDPDLGGGQLVYGHHRRGDPRNCTRVDWSLFLGYGRYTFSGVTVAAVAILRSHNIRYIGVTKAPFWRMFFCGGGGHWRSGTGYRALFVLACGPGGLIADAERQVLREARGLFLPLENAACSRGGEHVSRSERRPLFLYECTRCYDDRLCACQYCSAFRRRIFSDDSVDGGDGDRDDDDTTTLSHHGDHDNDDDTTTTTGADSGVAGAGPSSGLAEAVTPPLGSGSVAGGGVAATPAGPPLEPPLPPLEAPATEARGANSDTKEAVTEAPTGAPREARLSVGPEDVVFKGPRGSFLRATFEKQRLFIGFVLRRVQLGEVQGQSSAVEKGSCGCQSA